MKQNTKIPTDIEVRLKNLESQKTEIKNSISTMKAILPLKSMEEFQILEDQLIFTPTMANNLVSVLFRGYKIVFGL